MSWTNFDGLLVRYNNERSAVRMDGGESVSKQVFTYKVADATAITDTDTSAPAADEAYLPAGAIILSSRFVVDTTFTGATAVLDIGLKKADGTNIDDDGLDAAIAVASLTANAGITGDGALVGTKLAFDSYVMFGYDTAAFTAGAGRLIVEWTMG